MADLPILVAAMKDRLKIVKLLIKKGANVNDQDIEDKHL